MTRHLKTTDCASAAVTAARMRPLYVTSPMPAINHPQTPFASNVPARPVSGHWQGGGSGSQSASRRARERKVLAYYWAYHMAPRRPCGRKRTSRVRSSDARDRAPRPTLLPAPCRPLRVREEPAARGECSDRPRVQAHLPCLPGRATDFESRVRSCSVHGQRDDSPAGSLRV